MKNSFLGKAALFSLSAALSLSGCVKEPVPASPSVSDTVATALDTAARKNHDNLAMLARLRGIGGTPFPVPATGALSLGVTIDWTGPADGALREIANSIGYTFQETGKNRAQNLPVVVRAYRQPAHTVIDDIAWQIQPNAVVFVSPERATISLAGTEEAAKLATPSKHRRGK